jgi:hypothetical protein
VFSIFPLNISISQFVEAMMCETCRYCEFGNPPLDRTIDTVGRRIANDPTHSGTRLADAAELLKDKADVAAISRNHSVVMLFTSVALAHICQFMDNFCQFGPNRSNSL